MKNFTKRQAGILGENLEYVNSKSRLFTLQSIKTAGSVYLFQKLKKKTSHVEILNSFWGNYFFSQTLIWTTLREKCPNTGFFLARIFLHSDWIRRDTKTPYFGQFSHSGYCQENASCVNWTQAIQFCEKSTVKWLGLVIIWFIS